MADSKPPALVSLAIGRGHESSVVCVAVRRYKDAAIVLSGGEDGCARVWVVASGRDGGATRMPCIATIRMRAAVTACVLVRSASCGATVSPGGGDDSARSCACFDAFVAADPPRLHVFQRIVTCDAVNACIAALHTADTSPSNDAAAAATRTDPDRTMMFGSDEISSLAPALCDDGAPAVVGVDDDGAFLHVHAHTHTLTHIRRHAHTSLGACVAAYPRPILLPDASVPTRCVCVSGGFDSRCVLWDAAKASPLRVWEPGALAGVPVETPTAGRARGGGRSGAHSGGGRASRGGRGGRKAGAAHTHTDAPPGTSTHSTGGEAAGGATEGKILNPPFVHAVAWHPALPWFAMARGDGSVLVVDATTCQPVASGMRDSASAGPSISAHTCACVCVCWVRRGAGRPCDRAARDYVLVTAGEDKRLCAWELCPSGDAARSAEPAPASVSLAHTHTHTHASEGAEGGALEMGGNMWMRVYEAGLTHKPNAMTSLASEGVPDSPPSPLDACVCVCDTGTRVRIVRIPV